MHFRGQRHQDRIFIEDVPSAQRWLTTILRPLAVSRLLRLITGLFKRRNAQRKLCPFFVKLYERRWYVYAGSGRSQNEGVCAGQDYGIEATDEVFDFEPTYRDRESIEKSFGYQILNKPHHKYSV